MIQQTRKQVMLATAHQDHEKNLNLYAFFKLQDQALSNDLVQATFMKTWKYLIKGGKIDLMKAFLYHILNDLIIDEYRKNKATSLDVLLKKGFEPSIDTSERLSNILDGKTALALIQNLPKTYQKVMHMRYVQDMSIKEITLETKQSTNTVAVQAFRGLEKLKLLYSPI